MPVRAGSLCLLLMLVPACLAGAPVAAKGKFDPGKAAAAPQVSPYPEPEYIHPRYFYVNSSEVWQRSSGDSISTLKQAVAQARSASVENLSSALCMLGSLYAESGDLSSSMASFEEAAIAVETRLPKGSPEEAAIKHNIGEVFEAQKAYELAEHHYQDSIQLFQNAGKTEEVAAELDNLAQLYYVQKKLPQAEQTLKQCLAVRAGGGDNSSSELLNTIEELSNVLEAEGKDAEATPLIIRQGVLKDQLKALGCKDLPSGFNNPKPQLKKGKS